MDKDVAVGQKFGRLTITHRKPDLSAFYRGVIDWYYCDCDCGTKNLLVTFDDLVYAGRTSCGCVQDAFWQKTLKDLAYKKNLAFVRRTRRQETQEKVELASKYPLLKKFLGR